MKIITRTPLYALKTIEGPVQISQPCPGDSLAVLVENGRFTLPQPIIGWARIDGQLSIYTEGPDSSLFRLALDDDGFEEECFFSGKVPDHLSEYCLDEYAPGALLYYPVPVAQPAIMNVSFTMAIAA